MNQAFGQAAICIQRGSGPVIAIGDIGTGKSLLLAKLAAEHQSVFQVANIDCSRINSRKDLLQNILFQLGKPFNMESETELRFAVIESANPTEASPNGLLVLIDDAETLTAELFEELRVLTNIVVNGSPQVRLVLAGRRSLEERLADPALVSFSQRIASRVFLSNLGRDETFGYVVEHINRVGGDGQGMFPAETIAKLHELTDGCPRLINQVCDFVLILAGTRGATTISPSLIQEAWNDVQSLPMGSGSIATADASPMAETADNEWTLIEFGQLEDDAPVPTDGTVYDFENTAAPVEPAVADNPQPEAPAATPPPAAITQPEVAPKPQLDPVEAALASTAGIDPELGVDVGSLQAMHNATATQEAPVEPSDTAAPNTPAAESTANSELSEADDAARTAMEQQLAAVFGTAEPTTASPAPPASAPAEHGSNIESQSPQPVASNPNGADQPNQSNSIADLLSASAVGAGIAGAASQLMTPGTPTSAETFQPATPALDNPVAEQLVSEPSQALESFNPDPSLVSDSPNIPEPTVGSAPPVPSDQFTPATQPLDQNDQLPAAETFRDPAATTTPPAPNPFGESFAVESTIPDSVASETIAQNQNALKLSSADLSQLTPLHDPSPESIVQQAEPVDAAGQTSTPDFPEDEGSIEFSMASQVQEQATAAEAGTSLENPGPEPVVGESPAVATPDSSQRGFSILPMSTPQPAEPVAAEQAAPQIEQNATQIEQVALQSDMAAPQESTNITGPAESQSLGETLDGNTEDAELPNARNDEAVSEEISRKADEILARLQKNANLVPAVTQEEQILSNIQQQQREVADSQLLGEPEQQSVSIPEVSPHRDDSEMLVVNPNTSSPEAKPTPETLPMTDSPISSGRVTRMEYEQLFDRLRNQPEENQQ